MSTVSAQKPNHSLSLCSAVVATPQLDPSCPRTPLTPDKENYCVKGSTGTYNNFYKRQPASIGEKTYGGYSNTWRGPSQFAIPIPPGVDLASAAPMLCAGGTVYAPLKQYGAGTTAKRVGVVGIGGLGHFAVLFAKAMGASVTAITHGKGKIADAMELGAEDVIVTGEDAEAAVKGKERTLDLIISTSSEYAGSLHDLEPGDQGIRRVNDDRRERGKNSLLCIRLRTPDASA